MKTRDRNREKTPPGRGADVGIAGCPHNEAHWDRLVDVGLWAYSCSCGAVAYGITPADAKRVFLEKRSVSVAGHHGDGLAEQAVHEPDVQVRGLARPHDSSSCSDRRPDQGRWK